jgi:hypothetical protein
LLLFADFLAQQGLRFLEDCSDFRRIKRLRIFASAAGIIPGRIGCLVLARWTFRDVALLTWDAGTSVFSSSAAMQSEKKWA